MIIVSTMNTEKIEQQTREKVWVNGKEGCVVQRFFLGKDWNTGE
jgi:hypothetical protein